MRRALSLLVMTAFVMYFTRGQSVHGVDEKTAVIFLAANIGLLIVMLFVSKLLPAPPATNRRLVIPGSRYNKTALPAAV